MPEQARSFADRLSARLPPASSAVSTELDETLQKITGIFSSVFSEQELEESRFLASVGVERHPRQDARAARLAALHGPDLARLETSLATQQDLSNSAYLLPFIWSLLNLLDHVSTREERASYPKLLALLDAHASALEPEWRDYLRSQRAIDSASPLRVFRGDPAVQPSSLDAREGAERVKVINLGYKRSGPTQRELERSSKLASSAKPASSETEANSAEVTDTTLQKTFEFWNMTCAEKTRLLNASLARLFGAAKSADSPSSGRRATARLYVNPERASDAWLVVFEASKVPLKPRLATALGCAALRDASRAETLAWLGVEPGHESILCAGLPLPKRETSDDQQKPLNVCIAVAEESGKSESEVWAMSASWASRESVDLSRAEAEALVLRATGAPLRRVELPSDAFISSSEEPSGLKKVLPMGVGMSHEALQQRTWDRLTEPPYKLARPALDPSARAVPLGETGRTVAFGHTTHNLFVKDSKSKRLYLVTLPQARADASLSLSALGERLGGGPLRMAGPADLQTAVGLVKGCVTPLALFNNVQADVTWVVDDELLKQSEALVLCAGCENPLDHAKHHVVTTSLETLAGLVHEGQSCLGRKPPPVRILSFAETDAKKA